MAVAGHLSLLLLLLVSFTVAVNGGGVRFCVTQRAEAACQAMLKHPTIQTLSIQCVSGQDRYGCLRKVMEKEADVTWVDGEDVFMARELYDDQLHVLGETRMTEFKELAGRYQGIALVRRAKIRSLADLKGSKSCHTGYARTAGWNIPFSHLLNKGVITPVCNDTNRRLTVVEQDLKSASNFFGLACIPGRWAPDDATNNVLKEKYNNLCTMCRTPGQCDGEDAHAGYQGALRCLVDSFGDVAWTKISAVRQFFKEKPEVTKTDYALLCPDGRLQDMDSSKPCYWASRPWYAWVARSTNENKKGIITAMTQMMEVAAPLPTQGVVQPWTTDLLGIIRPSVIHTRSPSVTTRDYLKEHGYDITIERTSCSPAPVRLCVDSGLAHEKCQALSHVLKSRRVRPSLVCVTPVAPDNCFTMVAGGRADIASGDGGDIYRAHIEYDLAPVVSEKYGLEDATYYAVAVVKADSGINTLADLKGKKSCHTGIDKTAGWNIPVVTLIDEGLLETGTCNFPGQIGSFFSASCVPGAKKPRYDPNGNNPESLCQLCVGSEVTGANGPPYTGGTTSGRCERSSEEAFYGYTGAFRCLVQGGGDVAFVKHITVRDNTNGNNNASWAVNLRALDYKLLCLNNSTCDVFSYSTCNLARVPAHKVVSGLKDKVMREEVRILLLRASEWLPHGQDVFHMFGPYRGRHDLIFKDSATQLVNEPQDDFHQSLKDRYYRTISRLDSCIPKETTLQYTKSAGISNTPHLFFVLSALVCLLAH